MKVEQSPALCTTRCDTSNPVSIACGASSPITISERICSLLNCIPQSQGFLDTKTPLFIALGANTINFTLNPILIFKLGRF